MLAYFFFKRYEEKLSSDVLAKTESWCAQSLIFSEFESVVIQRYRHKLIDRSSAIELYGDFMHLMQFRTIDPSPEGVLQVAFDSKISSYDSQFVALAQEVNGILVTNDKKIVAEFPDIAVFPTDYLATEMS